MADEFEEALLRLNASRKELLDTLDESVKLSASLLPSLDKAAQAKIQQVDLLIEIARLRYDMNVFEFERLRDQEANRRNEEANQRNEAAERRHKEDIAALQRESNKIQRMLMWATIFISLANLAMAAAQVYLQLRK